MVNMQMGLNDVLYIFAFVSQPPKLMEGSLVHITGRAHQVEKNFHRAGGGEEVMRAEACIHQNRTLIRFDEKASHAIFHAWKIGTHRAAVEEVDGHDGLTIAHSIEVSVYGRPGNCR